MKIIGTTKLNTPCIWTCIGKGIEGLSKYINADVKIYDETEIRSRQIEPCDDKVIFIFEAGIPIHANFPLHIAKQYFPNSIFIPLATDTIFYRYRNEHQMDLRLVDLYLESHKEVVDEYLSLGIKSDFWDWNISDWFIDYIEKNKIKTDKIYDFIGVYHPGTIQNGKYRGNMIEYLQNHGYTFTNGGGNGHDDNDIDRLIKYYCQSKIVLGTSSHNISNTAQYRKGFRDFIGPFCDIPIIYDNYHEAIRDWGPIMPYYKFGDFREIVTLTDSLLSFHKIYNHFVYKQQNYARNNSIDKQLYRLLLKYNFINKCDLL